MVIVEVYGERKNFIFVIVMKSVMGNFGVGSGIVEVVVSLMVFNEGVFYLIYNFEICDLDCLIFVVDKDDVFVGDFFVSCNVML